MASWRFLGFSAVVVSLWLPALAPLRAEDLILVPRLSEWSYLPGTSEASPSDPAAWRAPGFDDGSWPRGLAAFGFGDPPYGTDLGVLEPPMRGSYSSLFLRRRFAVSDPSRLIHLLLLADYDDGFVAWINGTEVLRVNVAGSSADPVAASDVANRAHESGSYESFLLPDPEEYTVAGENVLAIQAFNVSITSTDFKFDLELVDPFGPDRTPPRIAARVPAEGSTVRRLTQVEVTFSEPVIGVDAGDLAIAGSPALSVRGAGQGPYLFSFDEPPPGTVQFAWADTHGVADAAEMPNAFPGGSWTVVLDPSAPLPSLAITELAALNRSGLADEDGDASDWIEIHNHGAAPLALAGVSLSDDRQDPGKWVFPDVVLEAGAYLVVFASGKDRRDPAGELHTSFRLDGGGEFAGIFAAESPRYPVFQYDPFPEQRADHSYGIDAAGSAGYFEVATPGQSNDGSPRLSAFVEDLEFSAPRGIYTAPFTLEIASATPGVSIYYTLDGSEPAGDGGILYEGPLEVRGTPRRAVVTLRAIGAREGYLPSRVATHSYVFIEHVLTQPPNPDGFPQRWGSAPAADYEMDPEVVNAPGSAERLVTALQSLPSLSVVAHADDIFGTRGIYSNPLGEGIAWERGCSAELIHDPTGPGFQIDCGIRILGGASRQPEKAPKHSFRLLFKGDWGPTKLRYSLFPDSPVDRFDTLVLRANFNNSWIHWDSGQRRRGMLLRDQWAKDTQLDMGQPGAHGRYVHLYVNGLYWGVYNLVERPSAPFAADHLGGEKEEYDALNSAIPVDGDARAWAQTLGLVRAVGTDSARYLALDDWIDLPNFIDYMLLNFYGSNADWDSHNWYAARRRVEGGRWRFFSWDAERILEGVSDSRFGVNESGMPSEIHNRLRLHPEYRLAFADRVHKHLFHGGALSPESAAVRLLERADEIEAAVVAEEARWGDYRRDVHQFSNGPYEFYRYTTHWLPEKQRLLNQYFPGRSGIFLGQLRGQNLYPRVEAPVLSRNGGVIDPGFLLSMSLPDGEEGTIYYTLDGTDPRLFGTGELAPSARPYTGPVAFSDRTAVKARTFDGSQWSALSEALFTLPPVFEWLHVSEIFYNSGTDDLEFLELANIGPAALDLSGVEITNGVEYVFPPGAALAPGGFLVLASDDAAFSARYPQVAAGGVYRGRLSNGGEKVTIRDPDGRTIVSVEYDDEGFWPLAADGFGCSLVLVDLEVDPDDPRAWRGSAAPGGSPGAAEPPHRDGLVWIHEVVVSPRGGALPAIEIHNTGAEPVVIGGWYLGDVRDDLFSLRKFRIPEGTSVPAGGYLVLDAEDFGGAFSLAAGGGELYLSSSGPDGLLGCEITGVEYGPAIEGSSEGVHRHTTGIDFTYLDRATLGGGNAPPRVGDLVIHEIMYHPPASPEGEPGIEWLEIHNRGPEALDLFDSSAGRGVRIGGIRTPGSDEDFEFPAGTRIAAGGYLLVAASDPETFRLEAGVPDGVPVIGPFGGSLDNAGERLSLWLPLGKAGTVLYARADHVRYNERLPWPVEADGAGASLERIEAGEYGNEVLNWAASVVAGGTPGGANSVSPPPVDGGLQLPSDVDQDGVLTISDPIALLGHLFRGSPATLPCGTGAVDDPANAVLFDANGDEGVNLSDPVYILNYLFTGGPEPVLGTRCVGVEGCASACAR